MTAQPADETTARPARGGALAPLANPTFRNIWLASLLANFGSLIQGVGAAWEMTRLTNAPDMVAMVQTAMMAPLMFLTVPAGAIADLFDRRKVALLGLAFAAIASTALAGFAAAGMITPWMLLLFCALIGTGGALYMPAWQASISDQVEPHDLPAAIALGSVSYNVARSFGPALGGAIVVAAGATAAFGVSAVSGLPLILAFLFWRRPRAVSSLPNERLDRAIVSGFRFVIHSAPARTAAIRAFAATFTGASLAALMPLVAKDVLHGDAGMYGLLLGGFGIGAVMGAFSLSRLRARFDGETLSRICALIGGAAIIIAAFSTHLALTLLVMMIAGVTWVVILAMLNVSVQLSSPRWVTARALAWFQASLTGGVAVGAWVWGHAAALSSLPIALAASGVAMMATPLLGLAMPISNTNPLDSNIVEISHEPEVNLPITQRSGPIVVEIDYRVTPDRAREFTTLMINVENARQRNGAFDWSLARDIANPTLWTERYQFPTWGDYLRQRARSTEADYRFYSAAAAFRAGDETSIRRKLERPAGALERFDERRDEIVPPQTP
ncbi:MAG: MFS transporter [Hyphomonadaceae bacterium]|nr:MFS transporter [Hyphomonadaceae bacterium]